MKVMVFGTFDDLHPGHLYFLTEAQKRGMLYVIVGRDANVLKIKGRAPLQSEEERMRAIQDHFIDATVMLGHPTDFLYRIHEVKPDLILLGYDQKLPPGMTEQDLGVPIERIGAYKPDVYKSSLRRGVRGKRGKA